MNKVTNTFKGNWKLIAIVAVVAFLLGMMLRPSASGPSHAETPANGATIWTCSMHPQIRQPEPGKCPICAMDLIPLVEDIGETDLGERQLRLSPSAQKLADVQTSRVERKSLSKPISLYGKIAVDETRQRTITAWVPGRIEKLFVDYTGATIKRGDALAQLYSPELFVAQQEYLNALKDSTLHLNRESIEKKFELWGITPEQIKEIEQRGTATERMTIESPLEGIVLQKAVTEGQYVITGATIFEMADLSRVWIYLNAYEQDLTWLKEGQSVSFSAQALPGRHFLGHIDFIDPVLDPASRTAKVRAVAENPQNQLKPGFLISAQVAVRTEQSALVVPASAVLLTGTRAVVYLAVADQNGVFEGRDIEVGERNDNFYVVKSGLQEGDKVVTNGAFKIDSEMQILAKKSMMSFDEADPSMYAQTHMNMAQSHVVKEINDSIGHQHEQGTPDEMTGQAVDMHTDAKVTDRFMKSLDDLYLAYFTIQDQLAHDKTEKLNASAAAMLQTLGKIDPNGAGQHVAHWQHLSQNIKSAATQLGSSTNMSMARAEFKKLSDALIETAGAFGVSGDISVKQYHCPMAFNDTGADWLSPKDDVENPYFGAEMFSCGWRVKSFGDAEGAEK